MTSSATVSPPGGRLARRHHQRQQRRRARRRLAWRGLVAAGAVAVIGAVAAATLAVLDNDGAGGASGESGPAEPAEAVAGAVDGSGEQRTLLLVRTRDDGPAAETATLVAADEADATVVLIPTGTLVDVPGVGLDRLALAGQYGGPRLVQASVENLLGIAIDHVAAVDGAGLGEWLDRADDLDGARLARSWGVADDEDELDVAARHRQALSAVLDATAQPRARTALADAADAGDDGGPLDTEAEAGWMDGLLARVGDAWADEAVRFRLLPVERVGGAGSGSGSARPTYRADPDETRDLTDQHLAASVPGDVAGGPPRLQVLNGVGTPGIGRAVEERVGGGRVRIVASDNAAGFDEERTRVVVYDDTDRSREIAAWVQERLGVGTIQVSDQPQSVVDVTVVVGADFEP